MKNHPLFLIGLVLLFFNCSTTTLQKPNILLILVDDMGWSDIGCYGSEVNTPNLDRLASEGIRFTQMHNTSKCFPSRATLQTGIYAQQSGYDKSYKQPLANCVTLGTVLQTAGYRTFWSGKHHGVETPVDIGYDRYYGLREGASNHFNPGPQREGEAKPAQKRADRPFFIDHEKHQPYAPP
jgi:arylsulfatase A-like enzyme